MTTKAEEAEVSNKELERARRKGLGSARGRLLLSSVLLAAWLGLLLTGLVPVLLAHLFLLAALILFPWGHGSHPS